MWVDHTVIMQGFKRGTCAMPFIDIAEEHTQKHAEQAYVGDALERRAKRKAVAIVLCP